MSIPSNAPPPGGKPVEGGKGVKGNPKKDESQKTTKTSIKIGKHSVTRGPPQVETGRPPAPTADQSKQAAAFAKLPGAGVRSVRSYRYIG